MVFGDIELIVGGLFCEYRRPCVETPDFLPFKLFRAKIFEQQVQAPSMNWKIVVCLTGMSLRGRARYAPEWSVCIQQVQRPLAPVVFPIPQPCCDGC